MRIVMLLMQQFRVSDTLPSSVLAQVGHGLLLCGPSLSHCTPLTGSCTVPVAMHSICGIAQLLLGSCTLWGWIRECKTCSRSRVSSSWWCFQAHPHCRAFQYSVSGVQATVHRNTYNYNIQVPGFRYAIESTPQCLQHSSTWY